MKKIKLLIVAIVFLLSSFAFQGNTEAQSNIVNPKQVYTYTKMVNDIHKLKDRYPDLVQTRVIGKSEYGRDIYAFSLGKGETTVFINGSHHAREWMTTTLNMYMAEQYAISYTNHKKIQGYDARKILDSTTIWFVPMVNPDGVTLQQKGLKAFPKKLHKALIKMNGGSKNFKRWKANGKGVDLNRQYNAGWKTIKNNSPSPSYANHKGKAPQTAAETKAILKFVKDIDPEMAVSYHASGEILYWNYKQNKTNYKRDHVYAKQIGKMTGYSLVYPGKNPSGGGFTDWFIQEMKRPGFTPEIGKHAGSTNLPLSTFPKIWKKNQGVGLYVAQEGHKLFLKRIDAVAKKTVANAKYKMWLPYKEFSKTGERGPSKEPVWASTVQKKINEAYAAKEKAQKLLNHYPIKNKAQLQSELNSNQKYIDNAKNYINARWAGNDLFAKDDWDGAVEKALAGNFKNLTVKGKDYSDVRELDNLYFDFDQDIKAAVEKISKVWNRGNANTRAALRGYYTEPANRYAAKIKEAAWAVHYTKKAEWYLNNPQEESSLTVAKNHLDTAKEYLNQYHNSKVLKKLVEEYYKEIEERWKQEMESSQELQNEDPEKRPAEFTEGM